MKTLTVLALLLTAACTMAGGQSKDKEREKKNQVDSGSFGIYVKGKRIGTEKFNIDQEANQGVLTAEITVDDGVNKAEQSSELRVGGDGSVKLYKWRSTTPTKEESVVEPKDERLVEHLTTSDQKKREIPYILPLSTVILDDYFFSQRELLIWRYLATGCLKQEGEMRCGSSHFPILVPHQHTASDSVVELLGPDKITVKGAERELNKIKAEIGGVQWLIWVDDPENHFKVIKMSIPSANVEVVRD